MSADPPQRLAGFRDKREAPFTFLSDPSLVTADLLDVAVSRRHPMVKKYPSKGFLQPALFVWLEDGRRAHEWRQRPGVVNGFGAMGRPSPAQMLEIVRETLATR